MNMRRTYIFGGVVVAGLLAAVGLAGCGGQTGPDSNTEVFKTPEAASAARRAKLEQDWRELAARIANAERPDIQTRQATDAVAVIFSADGVEQRVDLSPLSEKLLSANGKEREPIRAYLAQQWPAFDRARLKAMGFDKAAPMLRPLLVNMKQTQALTPAGDSAAHAPIVNPVVIDLNWVPVVRWPASGAQTPVEAEVVESWKVPAQRVSAAALENVRKEFTANSAPVFETVDLPGMGRYGTLRQGVDASIVLLPEFLAAVRTAWKTSDELVLFLPSRNVVNFIERKNEKLLDRMIPEWSRRVGQLTDPLIGQTVLDGDSGLSLLNYAPKAAATKPATGPATKRVYIVH
jgi:hypothetical protein